VASFLPGRIAGILTIELRSVLISFREWLHSYMRKEARAAIIEALKFSSLSESGFIPTLGKLIGS